MKRFIPVLLILFFSINIGLFASPYSMILAGDPVLEDLRYLAIETGRPLTSFTPPFAPQEIENFLNSLNRENLSEPGLNAYMRIQDRLAPQRALALISEDFFSLTVNLNLTLEARARNNKDLDWYSRYPKITPFFSFPLNFYFVDTVQLYMEPVLVMNREEYFDKRDLFSFNTSYDLDVYDYSMPFRAFVAAGGPWWNVQLGRDRLSHGTGQMGNLAISDNPDFYEFFRLSLFSTSFKYSMLVNQMPMRLATHFYDHDIYDSDDFSFDRTMNRYFYLHRLDFNFFDVLSIGFMEGVMVGNSPLEIRFLNPLMIFHSLYSWNNYDSWLYQHNRSESSVVGSFFSVEVNWSIIPSLSFYGQFAMNELATIRETDKTPDQPPNGLGFLLGIQYSHSFNTWASIFFFEFTSTSSYAYLNPSPFASYIHMRYISDSTRVHYTYIGYPRDMMVFTLGADFFQDDTFMISGIGSLQLDGEKDQGRIVYDWDKDATDRKNPTGTAEHNYILSLSARWRFNSYLTFNGRITGIFSQNYNHKSGAEKTGLQAAISATFSY